MMLNRFGRLAQTRPTVGLKPFRARADIGLMMRLMARMAVGGLLSVLAFGCGEAGHGEFVAPVPPRFGGTGGGGGVGGGTTGSGGGEGGVRLQPRQLEA